MAYTPIVPGSINPTITVGADQTFQSTKVTDFTGAAVDISGWTAFQAKLVPLAANPNTGDVSFGTSTGLSTGIVNVQTAASDLSGKRPGACRIIVVAKPTSGDELQLIASGTCTVQDG